MARRILIPDIFVAGNLGLHFGGSGSFGSGSLMSGSSDTATFSPEERSIDSCNSEGVPITKLYVSNIPKNATRKMIMDKFKIFGKVKKTYFKYSPTANRSILYCFITYYDKSCALMARLQPVKINNQVLKVTSADPWHQELPKKSPQINSKPQDYEIKENNILSILNDDCFRQILSYLSLRDLVRSERVSKRWRSLVRQELNSIREFRTKSWACEIQMQTLVFYGILKKIGGNLRALHLDQDWLTLSARIVFLIAKLCPNLIELFVMNLKAKFWSKVFSNCTQLKSLTFLNCPKICDATFKHCDAKIESLLIKRSGHSLGKFLTYSIFDTLSTLKLIKTRLNREFFKSTDRLANLSELVLHKVNVTPSQLDKILGSISDLKRLTLRNLYLNESNLNSITKFAELEGLSLSSGSNINNHRIRQFCRSCPKLKELEIHSDYSEPYNINIGTTEEISVQTFRTIFALKDLEVLNISGLSFTEGSFMGNFPKNKRLREFHCYNGALLTDNILYEILITCIGIKVLNLSNCKFTIMMFEKINEAIHQRGACAQNRLKIYHLGTSIQHSKKSDCYCIKLVHQGFNPYEEFDAYGDGNFLTHQMGENAVVEFLYDIGDFSGGEDSYDSDEFNFHSD